VSFLDQVIEFVKVVASEVRGPNAAVLYDVVGVGGFSADLTGADLSDDASEQASAQPAYSALGFLARPLPPSDQQNFLEAMAARTSDGLEPFAYRDHRLTRAANPTGAATAPAAGQQMLVGYGGAVIGHQMTAADVGDQRANITHIYVPYDFADGVPQKSHAIIIDPTPGNSSIQVIHGDGVRLMLQEETGAGPGIVATVDNATFLRLAAGELTVQAEKILLKGNVYLGRSAEAGLPLLAGAASPPGPSVFISAT
jgi:hypothetical protein